MYRFPFSLPDDTFETTVSPWLKALANKESVTVLSHSNSSQWHFVHQLLSKKKLLEKYSLGQDKTKYITIEMITFPIDSPDEFQVFLDESTKKKNNKIIIFILGSEALFDEKRELLSYFNSLAFQKKNISFIFFFRKNVTIPRIYNKYSFADVIYQNICLVPLFSPIDIRHFLQYESQRYKIKIPLGLTKQITSKSGGRMSIAKQAVRFYSRTFDEKHTFSHAEMNLRIRAIYEEFEEEEKLILQKIIQEKFYFSQNEKIVLDYLLNTKVIQLINKKYFISIPLLENYIKSTEFKKWDIHINSNNKLSVNGVIIVGIFSRREESLLKYFIKNHKKIVSREEIAQLLWKDLTQYTDWALDMSMKRLRTKLEQIGLDTNIIRTLRGRGFQFRLPE